MPNSPREIFELVFTLTVMGMQSDELNKYAREVIGNDKYQLWHEISLEELKAYLGFSILMGRYCLAAITG